MRDFDLAVIGAGAAGLSMAYVAAQLGLRVVLIERGRMGGECLNVGCVPSKALLAAAHAAHAVRHAGRYGVQAPEHSVDWHGVQAHVHSAIAALAPADSVERYTGLGATVLQGTARFVARDALVVTGAETRRITARRIVIATGSRPVVPDLPGLDSVPYLTNDTPGLSHDGKICQLRACPGCSFRNKQPLLRNVRHGPGKNWQSVILMRKP